MRAMTIVAPPDFDVLYRCEAKRYSYIIDADLDLYGVTSPTLETNWHRVERRTPCGAWIDIGCGSLRFVRLTARKKWACETKEEAIESFRARKKRQIRILARQLAKAKDDLSLVENCSEIERILITEASL